MNIQVFYNSTDITTSVISYDRDKAICTGVGVARLELKGTISFTPTLYNTFSIYENGVKKGTYYIHTVDNTIPDNTIVLGGQDASFLLQNYFIAENYFVDYPSNSKYWIEKFLTDSTVSYVFDATEAGTLLNNNTSLGMSSAMDQITPLLQQNGWYLHFDSDNVAHIGKLSTTLNSYSQSYNGNNIINLTRVNHDKLFRNRILVWGNGTEQGWVHAEANGTGTYDNEYGPNDVRTAVIANSSIKDFGAAAGLAYRALDEFDEVSEEITIEVVGSSDIDLGERVRINYGDLDVTGIVTTIASSMSASGLVTFITIGQRCPRLFAYYDFGGYVYAGTAGDGVWRKPLKDNHIWSDFSGGILVVDKSIVDLAIDSGVFACVSETGSLYSRTETTGVWSPYSVGGLEDVYGSGGIFPANSGGYSTCTINRKTGDIIAAFNLDRPASGSLARSWLTYYNPVTGSNNTYQFRDEDGEAGYTITALDNNGINNLVSATANISGEVYLWNSADMRNQSSYNTDQYVMSGYVVDTYYDLGAVHVTAFQYQEVAGDGKYIYDSKMNSETSTGITSLTVFEYNTKTGERHSATFSNPSSLGFIYNAPIQAVANRCVIIPMATSTDKIKFVVYSFLKGEVIQSFTSTLNGYVYSGAFTIHNGKRKFFFLYANNDVSESGIAYYDVDANMIFPAGHTGIPTTFHSATIMGLTNKFRYVSASVTEDYIVFAIDVIYNASSLGWGIQTIEGALVFYPLYGGNAQCSLGVAETAYGYSGFSSVDNLGVNAFATANNYAYVGFQTTNGLSNVSHVIRINPFYSVSNTTWTGSGAATPTEAMSKNDKAYFVIYETVSTSYVIDAATGSVVHNFSKSVNDLLFIKQLDANTGGFFVLDIDTEILTHYTANSGVQATYDLTGIVPTGDVSGTPLEYNRLNSYGHLVFDTFNITVTSQAFHIIQNYYGRNTVAITPTVSGERLSPVDYTKYIKDKHQIMYGYGDESYVLGKEVVDPYMIESSLPNYHLVFGGTAYSGIIVNGSGTGFNQGRMFLTAMGNAYTNILLNGLNSFVGDARMFNAVLGPSGLETMSTFIIYPQPSTYDLSGESYIYLVDVTDLSSNTTNIITSGTLNQYGSYLETFPAWVTHLETSNTLDIPYIFASLSGSPSPFYQKDTYLAGQPITSFVEYSDNLPNSPITCIRCDDRI